MAIDRLDSAQIASELQSLNQTETDPWRIKNDKLNKTYQFGSFISAFAFMTKIAIIAEKMDHHPEWFNVYNKVVIDLTTHEAAGISAKDFSLARKIQRVSD